MVKAKDIDVPRLCTAIQRSRLALQRARQTRVMMVREYCGPYCLVEGAQSRVPVNLLSMYVQIISRSLVAKNPRVMLSTFQKPMKPVVSAMQTWANREIQRMKLDNTLQRMVIDALFSIGIVKVALADPAVSAASSWNLKAGEPFAERVDLDDFVYDMHARDFGEVAYIGHRYRVPLEVVMDSKLYSKARKKLVASTDKLHNEQGDERISVIGRGTISGNDEEFEDMVDLWEIYLPRHRVVLTLSDDYVTGAGSEDDEPLRQQGWLGPDMGPYHLLGFGIVPGNAMYKAPVQDLFDLHMAVNQAYRKATRANERTKEVTIYQQGQAEDAERLRKSSDGDMVGLNRPDSVQALVMGGNAVQALMGFAMVMKDLFNRAGGNLELLGGQGPQSKTATQDELLNQNAGAGMADMQARTVNSAASVIRALCWFWYSHPYANQRSTHSLPGVPGMQRSRVVTPQMRQQGRFEDMDVEVDPYSLQHSSPQQRIAALDQLMQNILIPLAPFLQQQGIVTDMNAYLKLKAQFGDMPDMAELLTLRDPIQPEAAGGASEAPGMPSSTSRTYNRVSMPGRTQQGNDQNMASQMMGVKPGGAPGTNGQPMGAGR